MADIIMENVTKRYPDGFEAVRALDLEADVGVAMGGSGTAVARESAELVLADDNFATVAAAVEEGRHVYDKLVKLAFVLPTNLGEALLILVAVVAFPITAGDGPPSRFRSCGSTSSPRWRSRCRWPSRRVSLGR